MKAMAAAQALQFRWINGQCFEIKLPSGKVILTDPFFPSPSNSSIDSDFLKDSALDVPFDVDDLSGADYIIINHTHGDHIFKLEEIAQRFHSRVIIHSSMAPELARTHAIGLSKIYPVDFNGTYYLEDFALETFHGTHHPVEGTLQEEIDRSGNLVDERTSYLSALGGMLNMNFIISTPENISIGFVGGDDDGDYAMYRQHLPTILFRNKLHSSASEYDVAKDWAEYLHKAHIPLMVPMHHEKWFVTKPGYVDALINEMNRLLIQKGSVSRVLNPERTKWYSLNVSIAPVE